MVPSKAIGISTRTDTGPLESYRKLTVSDEYEIVGTLIQASGENLKIKKH